MPAELCLIRGGGDLATGVAWCLSHADYPVIVAELPAPLAVRRTVALSSAIDFGEITVEGMLGRRVDSWEAATKVAHNGDVAVIVAPEPDFSRISVAIDARVAKRNIDTSIDDAELVIALGPGFSAGHDCHAVIETMRGPRLGHTVWKGSATANTGTPAELGGRSTERVLRALSDGTISWSRSIGDRVSAGELLGRVGNEEILCPFDGRVRGMIRDGHHTHIGQKIGDIDPRVDARCDKISDKSLAVGDGVLEAVRTWQSRSR